MVGREIIARSMSIPTVPKRGKLKWQYHPRSDQHSKVVCWAILLDLLAESEELRNDARAGRSAFGINHTMRDFTNDRKKKLDLVVCRPKPGGPKKRTTFRSLVKKYLIELTDSEMKLLNGLPDLEVRPVGTVLIALEAKAAMTEFGKARPRLYSERPTLS